MPHHRVAVWDPLVRLIHWALAITALTAWLSGHLAADPFLRVHPVAGHVAAGWVALRLIWGFLGSRHARLRQFVCHPRDVYEYVLALHRGRAPRHLGHNPLGGWMALVLWSCMVTLWLSGWLMGTDTFWGEGWLQTLHGLLAWGFILLVCAHLVGVATVSWRHRENLIAAMFSGRKRAPAPGDIH